MSRKPLVVEEGSELAKRVKEVEEIISQPESIWGDEDMYHIFRKLDTLSLEERRLLIVYSLYDCSVSRVATLFQVDFKTIRSRMDDIRRKIC